MKPIGRIDFAFDTGLMVCLRDDIKVGELQVSFEEVIELTVGSRRSPIFIVSDWPDTKRGFHGTFA